MTIIYLEDLARAQNLLRCWTCASTRMTKNYYNIRVLQYFYYRLFYVCLYLCVLLWVIDCMKFSFSISSMCVCVLCHYCIYNIPTSVPTLFNIISTRSITMVWSISLKAISIPNYLFDMLYAKGTLISVVFPLLLASDSYCTSVERYSVLQ